MKTKDSVSFRIIEMQYPLTFQLHSKDRQKDIVRDVMRELGAGPQSVNRYRGGIPLSFFKKKRFFVCLLMDFCYLCIGQ